MTDANLVLGRINADFFLGGKMKLRRESAVRVLESHIASRLNLSVTAAAAGMVEIANSNMIAALRLISVERGQTTKHQVWTAPGRRVTHRARGVPSPL